ncbi:type II toxin-antitoxin system VapB family antitoxin [Zoogloea sp.]|uniref:antitoxin n=1 Tax=Zoogloea sp. TaxID=49181 RepID=UPI001AD28BF8|nr:type II toxin-antitoxin system VapB family antitoxin [Zoogloea sp.]MBN8284722.1 antitoxin [Zoogloea sp.]
METAKLFWSGRSQAVRLPKDFRIEGSEVRIRRHGAAVILEPIANDWAWLDALAAPLDPDFQQAAGEQPSAQENPELGRLFD